jgi:hypothetical protein
MGMHLMGMQLMGMHLMGMHLIAVHLMACIFGRVPHEHASHSVHLISLCLIPLGGKCNPRLTYGRLQGGTYF